MAEYAQDTFDVEAYMAKRPRYPDHLYDILSEYQVGPSQSNEGSRQCRTLLDLGCGPGMASWPLLEQFDRMIGVDPGEAMIDSARKAYATFRISALKQGGGRPIAEARFEVSKVEELHRLGIADASIDCVIAATAAHWFDMGAAYGQLQRIMRSGATLAMWTYDLAYPSEHASTVSMVSRFAYEDLKGFVDLKGSQTIRSLYAELELPGMQDWKDIRYIAYPNGGKRDGYLPILPWTEERQALHPSTTETGLTIEWDPKLHTSSTLTWQDLKAAKRTNSSYHNWRKQNPDVRLAEDIAAKQVDELRQQVTADRRLGIGSSNEDEMVNVMRPMGLLLMRRR